MIFQALHEIAVATSGVLDPAALARLVAEHAVRLLGADGVAIYEWDEAAGVLRPLHLRDPHGRSGNPMLPSGVGLAGQAFERRAPEVISDYPAWEHAEPSAVARGVQAAVAVPLIARGRAIGAVGVRFTRPGGVREADLRILQLLVAQIAPSLEAAQQYRHSQEARAVAEQAVALRDRVLAVASHDLRQPLGAIRLLAEMLRLEAAATPGQTHLAAGLARLEASATRMERLVEEMVDVAHLQLGQELPLQRQRADLVSLTCTLLAEHEALDAGAHQFRLDLQVPTLTGFWDTGRLDRLLGNLLGNARKYSPDGGTITVELGAEDWRGRRCAILRVVDQGIGIPAAELTRVLEPFHRARNVPGVVAGSGLGLSIVRYIAEQHGGEVTLASAEDAGTTVTVHLPLQQDSERLGWDPPLPLHTGAPWRGHPTRQAVRPSA